MVWQSGEPLRFGLESRALSHEVRSLNTCCKGLELGHSDHMDQSCYLKCFCVPASLGASLVRGLEI